MKKIYSFLFLFISIQFYGQWVNLNTGINDNLNGVVFFQDNGIVSGENGLYYTTNANDVSPNWTELHIPSNPVSDIFEDTKFTHCYALKTNTTNTGIVYACGQTVSESKAVLFKITIPSMTCELIYHGLSDTKLNKVDCLDDSRCFAVGDDGKILRFSSSGSLIEVVSNTTEDLLAVASNLLGRVAYGSNNKVWTAYVGSTVSDIGGVQNSSIEVKDICEVGSTAYIVGGNKFSYVYFNNSGTNGSFTNFSIPLNANAVIYSNATFVGTSNGIYKFINNCLELQPSSLNYHINEFWFQNGSTYTYACGNNGVLLRTSNSGGASIPYVVINANGTCINGTVQFRAIIGSGNSVNWYIDNQLVSTSLTGFNRTFNSPGQYLVRLEVRNSFNEMTTVSKYINIVNIPTINKPITISDEILCKEEAIQITIENSEPNVKYVLRKDGLPNSNYGESEIGNGGSILLNSTLIDLTGNYYLEALSTLANCNRRFDDNFLITVEETKADFHSDLINANIDETINFYNQSNDASIFEWEIELNSQIQNSVSENVQTSFNDVGLTTVTLESWSINGCYDIVTTEDVEIINNENIVDSGFILGYNIEDNSANSTSAEIRDSKLASDGYLNCGTYKNAVFNTRVGKNFVLNGKGGYLAKHDFKGVLKWVVYTNITADGNAFNSVIVDNMDNIYISGIGNGYFFDNSGEKIDLNNGLGQYFLIKLDSKGKLIWVLQNNLVFFESLHLNSNQYFIATTRIRNQYTYYSNIPIYKNGVLLQNIGNTILANDSNFGLIKFDFNANIIWENEIKIVHTNATMIFDVEFDSNNNIYLTNSSESTTTYYSLNGVNKQVLGNGSYGGKSGIAKYDNDGNCLWAIRTRTHNTAPYDPTDSTTIYDILIDNSGNIYAVGKNECEPNQMYNYTHFFDNSDGTTTQTTKGSFFLAKINTNGICEWIRSTENKVLGNSTKIIKENDALSIITFFSSSNTLFDVPLQTVNNNFHNVYHDKNNYLILKYTLEGELLKVVSNSGISTNFSPSGSVKSFLKGQDGYYYISRHSGVYSNQNLDFGMSFDIPAGDNIYGFMLKCKDDFGVVLYDANVLSESNFLLNNIKIYPNPSNGEFSIDFGKEIESSDVEIYDLLGHLIFKNKYVNHNVIDLSLNPLSGIYLVKIKNEKGQYIAKIIIE